MKKITTYTIYVSYDTVANAVSGGYVSFLLDGETVARTFNMDATSVTTIASVLVGNNVYYDLTANHFVRQA